jgi:3-methyladenine DNA glycosylase AlkC
MDRPELSLATLKELTKAMSAEFAIRPFLLKHRDLSLKTLAEWAADENVHVRRLASEGTRPRLPWGQRLPDFQRNPEACVGLLRQLKLDPEIYVRKSVANHLNDFSKDHPDWLVKELASWQKEFPKNAGVQWIIRHACRGLIKAGHPGALALIGIKAAKIMDPALKLKPAVLQMGRSLEIRFSARAERKESWLIDYAIHHRKSNGGMKPKVFKWTRRNMAAGEKLEIGKAHRFMPISTRKYYAGKHEVEIFVNGKSVARKAFILKA